MINPKKNPLIYGTLLLSASGLICRGLGFFYRLFVSRAFGEEAMGIFQLVSPVIMLSYSLTSAGIQTAISRFTAYSLARKEEQLCRKYLVTGIIFSMTLSFFYSFIVYGQAETISVYFLHEKRCTALLRILAFSFPISTLHSCFNGYFYGKKETKLPSFAQIAEQLCRVGSVMALYHYFVSLEKEPTIMLTCIGMLMGEAVALLITLFYYFFHAPQKGKTSTSYRQTALSLLGYALPLTFNRVVVNILHSLEAVSIPLALRKFGYSTEASLSIYGVFTGMALSLVLFPSTFTNSAAVLLLPAVSEAASTENKAKIRTTLHQSLKVSLLLGTGFSLIFYLGADFLGNLLFDSRLAGILIGQISFLCPFLYLHTTLSSIMNGLKQTGRTLFINIFSLLLRLLFVMTIIPLFGISGYLWGLLLSEALSAGLCIWYLRKYF